MCSHDVGITWARRGQVQLLKYVKACHPHDFKSPQKIPAKGVDGRREARGANLVGHWRLWCGKGDRSGNHHKPLQKIFKLSTEHLNNVQCSVLYQPEQLISPWSTGRCGTGKPSVGSWLPPISGDHQSGPNINKCSVNCISFYSFRVIFSCSMYIFIAMQWSDKSQRSWTFYPRSAESYDRGGVSDWKGFVWLKRLNQLIWSRWFSHFHRSSKKFWKFVKQICWQIPCGF